MKLESKYDLNNFVHSIERKSVEKSITCSDCDGTGFIKTLSNNKVKCTFCHYGTISKFEKEKWLVGSILTIGKIAITKEKLFIGVTYMCKETGIGAGTVWKENLLWSTKDLAQLECDRLNKI